MPFDEAFHRPRASQPRLIRLYKTPFNAASITNAFHKRKFSVLIFFDLAKTIDKIWYTGILAKLHHYSTLYPASKFIQLYVVDSHFYVTQLRCNSCIKSINLGVPLCSLIGQEGSIRPRTGELKTADDTAIIVRSMDLQVDIRFVEEQLQSVAEYCKTWRLFIKTGKTHFGKFQIHRSSLSSVTKFNSQPLLKPRPYFGATPFAKHITNLLNQVEKRIVRS